MYYVDVNVTDDDIKKGIRGSSCYCPVALAIKRELKITQVVGVTTRFVYTTDSSCKLPEYVGDFIRNFDIGYNVDPIKFRLTFSRI